MLTGNTRRIVVAALALAVAALVYLAAEESPRGDGAAPRPSSDTTRQESAAAPDRPRIAATSPDRIGEGEGSGVATGATQTQRAVTEAPMRLQVNAPPDVQVGEIFEVRIDFEAGGGVRLVTFGVSYAKSRLALAGWAEGDFASQGGLPAALGAEEPSDGNVEVAFDVANGLSVSGSGTLVVLRFEAIKAGTSGITLRNVIAVDRSGVARADVDVRLAGPVAIH